MEDLEIIKAEQQLTGFIHAYQGYDIVSLIKAMGLLPEEWEVIKKELHMPRNLHQKIEDYFLRWETR